ncbi:unnamed protein product [Camellia sinensis]
MAKAICFAILGNIQNYLFAPIGRQLGYLFGLNSNIQNLKVRVEQLATMREGLLLQVDEAKRKGEIVEPEVEKWISDVTEFTAEAVRAIDEKVEIEKGSLGGCLNLKSHYLLSRKANKMTQVDVDELISKGNFTQISYPADPAGIGYILPTRSFMLESRMSTMKEVMETLKDDEINMIGICGMGGIGKTTMVKDVVNRARNEHLFDTIVMAVVSQIPDLRKIQDRIAHNLDFKLKEEETLLERATHLRQKLATVKRILIVLDDVWERIDLQGIGIPFWSENRGCKVVLTSRSLNVCREMGTQKNVEVKTLTGEEAWRLFKEVVGDSVEAPDLRPIAEQVANECGGLPIALVAVGGVLKHKSNHAWTDALRQLRIDLTKTTDEKVHEAITMSYNRLEPEEAKSLFLLCGLYPEDHDIQIEDLVRFGMGLRLLEDIDRLGEARDQVHALVDILKTCCLLLDSDKDECVKMHDVIRDVAIAIASKGGNVFLIQHSDSLTEWPEKHTCEPCTSISIISGKITELPEGLSCPKLILLLLACMNDSITIPNNFFEGMRELRVLNLELISIPLLPSSLQLVSNLHTICLQGCKLDNITLIGELLNLEILSFRGSSFEVLPEEIGKLANLRLLDLTGCHRLERIMPGVISGLVKLEELYLIGSFSNWETDKGETTEERRNASLRELQSLSDLRILEIYIPDAKLLPRSPLFTDLTQYKIRIGDDAWWSMFPFRKHLLLKLDNIIALDGGVSKLLKCTELLSLKGKGSWSVVRELVKDGAQHLKELSIESCDMLLCLADTMDLSVDSIDAIFPILESLKLDDLGRLKQICHGQLPAASFSKLRTLTLQLLPSLTHFLVEDPAQTTVSLHNLRFIELYGCNCLRNLFSLSMARELVQLQELRISKCAMIREVIWKGRGEDGHATNKIEFPRLEYMSLRQLEGLTGFSLGIDKIEFPQLKTLHIKNLPKIRSFFPNESTVHSDENCNATLQSIFPQKAAFPSLENLELGGLPNVSDLWCSKISTESFSKLRFLKVEDCHGLVRNVVPAHILKMSPNLEDVEISNCDLVEEVFGYVGHQGDPLENIRTIIVRCCDSLGNVFSPSIARCLVHLQELIIDDCKAMEAVVANENEEQDGGERIYVPLFPQLKHLELRDLPSLRRFCHAIHVWEMPFLYHVEALNCPEMQTFSPGFVYTPKLQHVKVEEPNWWNAEGNRPESIWIDDLNKTIHHLFEKRQQEDKEDEEEEEEQQRIQEIVEEKEDYEDEN